MRDKSELSQLVDNQCLQQDLIKKRLIVAEQSGFTEKTAEEILAEFKRNQENYASANLSCFNVVTFHHGSR
jgi:hypothetical protein